MKQILIEESEKISKYLALIETSSLLMISGMITPLIIHFISNVVSAKNLMLHKTHLHA